MQGPFEREKRGEERIEKALYYNNFNMDQRKIHRMSCRCDCEEFENKEERRILQHSVFKEQEREKKEEGPKKQKEENIKKESLIVSLFCANVRPK